MRQCCQRLLLTQDPSASGTSQDALFTLFLLPLLNSLWTLRLSSILKAPLYCILSLALFGNLLLPCYCPLLFIHCLILRHVTFLVFVFLFQLGLSLTIITFAFPLQQCISPAAQPSPALPLTIPLVVSSLVCFFSSFPLSSHEENAFYSYKSSLACLCEWITLYWSNLKQERGFEQSKVLLVLGIAVPPGCSDLFRISRAEFVLSAVAS